MRSFLCAILCCLAASSAALAAPNTTVIGRITEAAAGLPLPGATITLKGTRLGTVSDHDGNFRLIGVQAGAQTVVVTYLGFQTMEAPIDLVAGRVLTLNLSLEPGILSADEVVVVGERLQGQARAINQQRTSLHIANIVASDQLGRFPDANIGDAMKRIPGIVVAYDQGEARFGLIRGTEARMNSVMLNGERVPSAEGEVRAVQLDLIPADMIQTVEVSKALTPDMDADAIGGAVNLITRAAPQDLRISGTLGSGYNMLSEEPMGIGALVVGDQFLGGRLGVLVNSSYHNHHLGSDDMEMEWDEDDGVAFPSEQEVRDYDVHRIRRSLGGAADFQLDDSNRLFARSLWNHRNDYENRYRLRLLDLTSPVDGQAGSWEIVRQLKGGNSNTRDARLEDQRTTSTTIGGVHAVARDVEVSWSATWSKASEERPNERYLEYAMERDEDAGDIAFGLSADLSDPEKPLYGFDNPADAALSNFEFSELTEEFQQTEETDINGRVDVEFPWLTGDNSNRIVSGLRLRSKDKHRSNSFFEYEPLDEGAFANLGLLPTVDATDHDFLAGDYAAGIFPTKAFLAGLDLTDATRFAQQDKPEEYVPGNYDASETITGGYVMLEQNVGPRLALVAGVRVENTSIDYTGNELYIDPEAEQEFRITSTRGDQSYAHVLPGLHGRYQIDARSVLRFAWTNTIARPNYYDLVPYREVIIEDAELREGNPALEPTESMNFDLSAERYFDSIGLLSAGVFHKNIDNFTFFFAQEDYLDPTTGQLFDDYVQPRNGKGALVRGIELSLHRQLSFVPGLGIYTNYTLTDSEIDELPIEGRRDDKLPLPGTAKHTVNGSLSYERNRVALRLSANYTSSHIDAGEGDFSDDAFEDRYYDEATHVDLNGSVRLTPEWRVFFEANNLTNQPLRFYQGVVSRTAQAEYYDRRVTMGLKFDL